MDILEFPVGQMRTNCYVLVKEDSRALIVDPGDDAEYLAESLLRQAITPQAIVLTHGHFDHAMAAFALQVSFGIPCYVSEEDGFLLASMVHSARHFLGIRDSDPPPLSPESVYGHTDVLDAYGLTILKTPGHTPGSISLYCKEEAAVFSGDLVFAEGYVGRTDFSYSNKDLLWQSIRELLSLPAGTTVYPGHGESITIDALGAIFH